MTNGGGAPLGTCPLCKGKDPSLLYAGDINKIHTYIAGKGIKVAMWGDFLLESVRNVGVNDRVSSTGVKYQTPGGLRPEVVKEKIPKDILILNWFWNKEAPERELNNFGFKQIYGNFTPDITNWDARTKKFNLVGGAPSSWAATNEFNFGKDVIWEYLGCANFVWSNHSVNITDLPAIASGLMPFVRSNLSGKRIPSKDGDPIETIDISPKFNLSKDSKDFSFNLGSLITGEAKSQEKIFKLDNSAKGSGNCAIAVSSVGTGEHPLPSVIEGIPINEDVSSLMFLQACALPSNNSKAYFDIPDFFDSADLLGWYEVVYEDGFKTIVPIQYAVNILEYNPEKKMLDKMKAMTGSSQTIVCSQADPVNCSSSVKDNPITFYAFEWVNPRFGKKIKEVNLHGTENYQTLLEHFSSVDTEPMKSNAIILAGISMVKKREKIQPGN